MTACATGGGRTSPKCVAQRPFEDDDDDDVERPIGDPDEDDDGDWDDDEDDDEEPMQLRRLADRRR